MSLRLLQLEKVYHEQKRKHGPPRTWLRLGALWRTQPIRRSFGFKYGQSIDRYYIEQFLNRYSGDIRGRVLEMADNAYTRRFGGSRITQSDVLHSKSDNPNATIVADLTRADEIPSNTFDCIILTQTLQFIYETRSAIRTLYRILRPGGVLLAAFPGISQIARYDMDNWGEYWRFTTLSARMLFSESFPESQLSVAAHGNVLAAMAFLQGLVSRELRQDELDYQDRDYEMLITVRAVKPHRISPLQTQSQTT
jgi:SAM-dependent methyltransferase